MGRGIRIYSLGVIIAILWVRVGQRIHHDGIQSPGAVPPQEEPEEPIFKGLLSFQGLPLFLGGDLFGFDPRDSQLLWPVSSSLGPTILHGWTS